MNHLQRYANALIKWMLAAAFIGPALVFAHGAVDIPIAKQVHCKTLPDFWSGSPSDAGCAAVDAKSGPYPGQQWNEVAKLIAAPGYNDPDIVKREVPDGQLCSAADSKKDGLNLVLPYWYRIDVTPVNGMMDVRIIGTAPHVPSFAKVYLTKPGFNPAASPLTWNDLVLLHTEQLTVAQTNWGNEPPAISASGFFKFKVPVPAGQVGPATLFVQWQRIDPAGEGFYNCSDINLVDAAIPGAFFDLGQFIEPIMDTLKAGDSVHFRILDNTPAAKEAVDITLPITTANLDPKIWGAQLANQINPSIARVGEKQGNNIVFNSTNPRANSVFALAKGYSKAMAIIPGGGPAPTPTAQITGPTRLIAGQTYTFHGKLNNAQNTPQYTWAPVVDTTVVNQADVTGTAPRIVQPTNYTVRLNARDGNTGPTYQATYAITVEPANSGGYPPYQPGTAYQAGDKVSHNGSNYECKPWPATGWCSLPAYEPGHANGNWVNAWNKL
ncbi:chitin-binding protein [Pseudomonas azotoformans]|uniref:Chitin-binding protein n=1 Tax=Pseudomonas azotoformans TaxID=47878 RepID=A0A1V2JKB9_PSEAZ|nr:lytic polysaccharide monooxygenase [Pseudomonas azotoformans]OIN48220.1 chitin-binding protein [Pseudomonas azotoformans]ONH45898.1 chitin-binding protein [Pseudomonas azotoformans]SDO16069.1 chitin-binding protein [Pseudomonas azotoformans]